MSDRVERSIAILDDIDVSKMMIGRKPGRHFSFLLSQNYRLLGSFAAAQLEK